MRQSFKFYLATILTNLFFITITFLISLSPIEFLISSLFNAASFISSSDELVDIFILALILPFSCIAISTTSFIKALGLNSGHFSLKTEELIPISSHCSSAK